MYGWVLNPLGVSSLGNSQTTGATLHMRETAAGQSYRPTLTIDYTPPSQWQDIQVNVSVTDTTATLTWTTNNSRSSVVDYGTTSSYTKSATGSTGTSHSVTITGLTPNTTYHYRVTSNAAGLANIITGDRVFSTTAGSTVTVTFQDGLNGYGGTQDTFIYSSGNDDRNFGALQGMRATSTSDGTAIGRSLVKFTNLNLPAGVKINSAKLSLWAWHDYSDNTAHSFAAYGMLKDWGEGMAPDWGYDAKSGESSWNVSASPTVWAASGAAGDGVDRMGIPDDTQSMGGNNQALVFDVTNSFTQQYSTGNYYGWQISPNATNCNMEFCTREYVYYLSWHPKLTVTYTPDLPIMGIESVKVSSNIDNALVSWTSSVDGSSAVEYGTTTAYGMTATSTDSGTAHNVTLYNLQPNTLYHYRVRTSAAGYADGVSADKTFVSASLGTNVATFRDGLNGYAGTRDAFIVQKDVNGNNAQNFGALTDIYCSQTHSYDMDTTSRGLIKFTGVALPSDAQITGANLVMTIHNDYASPAINKFAAFPLLHDWSEGAAVDWGFTAGTGESSWLCSAYPTNWGVAGADRTGFDRSAIADDVQCGNGNGTEINFDVTNTFKQQYASGANYGWVIVPMAQDTNVMFFSRQWPTEPYSLRPRLEVRYTAPVNVASSIGDAKNADPARSIALANKEVTAAFTDEETWWKHYFYIEDADRASGIKVVSDVPVMVGDVVSVVGNVVTENGEKVINASAVYKTVGSDGSSTQKPVDQQIKPLAMNMKAACGAGLSCNGLLVKLYGSVTDLNYITNYNGLYYYAYIDDGTGLETGSTDMSSNPVSGIFLYDDAGLIQNIGEYWSITGILANRVGSDGKIYPSIRPRSADDYTKVN